MAILHYPVQAACPLTFAESSTPHADSVLLVLVSWVASPMRTWWGYLRLGWGLVHLRVWAGVCIWMGIPSCLLIRGMQGAACRKQSKSGGWEICRGLLETRCSTVGRNHFRGRKSNFSVTALKKCLRSGVINESLFVNSEDS